MGLGRSTHPESRAKWGFLHLVLRFGTPIISLTGSGQRPGVGEDEMGCAIIGNAKRRTPCRRPPSARATASAATLEPPRHLTDEPDPSAPGQCPSCEPVEGDQELRLAIELVAQAFEVREDRVVELRRQIRSKSYRVAVDRLAERLLRVILG